MNTSSDKLVKSHTRRPRHSHERGTLREIESLLIETRNNGIRTNYIKVKIDNTLQNSKCQLYGNRDTTINQIISEGCKLAQREYRLDKTG